MELFSIAAWNNLVSNFDHWCGRLASFDEFITRSQAIAEKPRNVPRFHVTDSWPVCRAYGITINLIISSFVIKMVAIVKPQRK